ncbi:MAG: hypothetical protein H6817_08280 [Phycisphaerales bacterium]|nr:hypothetical protein [Phycisphaerales bacterium]
MARQRSGTGEPPRAASTSSTGVAAPSGSTARPAPARKRRGLRVLRFLVLLILPLVMAAGALVVVPKQFPATVHVDRANARPQTSATSDADIRSLLLDYAWAYARQSSERGKDVAWSLDAAASDAGWDLRLTGPTRKVAEAQLAEFSSGLKAHIATVTSAQRERLTEKERDIAQRLSDLSGLLSAVDAEITNSQVAVNERTPLEELTDTNAATRIQWGQYTELRDRVRSVTASRDALQEAPPIEHAVVDAEARESAYRNHIPLQEDMRHLEIQLFQIQSTMVAIGKEGGDSLNTVLAAAEEIGKLTETAAAENATAAERPLLEQTSEKAAEYHHIATIFAQAWTRDLLRLEELQVDARTAEILRVYDEAAKRIRDFQQDSEQATATLRRRIRALGEQADPNAATQVAQATLVRKAHDLQTAYRTFDRSANELIAQDNYLLDAALQSARGLWQRTQATRRDIDDALEQQAVQRAREERTARIAAMTAEIESTRGDIVTLVDEIKAQSDAAQQIIDRLPAYVIAATAGESARDRRVLLESRANELSQDLADIRVTRDAIVSFDDLAITTTPADNWPQNLETVAGAGLLAWSLGLLLTLGVVRITSKPHA